MFTNYCILDILIIFVHEIPNIDMKSENSLSIMGVGCCAFDETWAKYIDGDSLGHQPCVKVVKKECHNFDGEYENIETYILQGDALKLTSKTKRKY